MSADDDHDDLLNDMMAERRRQAVADLVHMTTAGELTRLKNYVVKVHAQLARLGFTIVANENGDEWECLLGRFPTLEEAVDAVVSEGYDDVQFGYRAAAAEFEDGLCPVGGPVGGRGDAPAQGPGEGPG